RDRHRARDRLQRAAPGPHRHGGDHDPRARHPPDAVHDPLGDGHAHAHPDVDGGGRAQPGRLEVQDVPPDHRAHDGQRHHLGRDPQLRGDRHRDGRGHHPLQQPDHHAHHVGLRRHHARQLRPRVCVLDRAHGAHRHRAARLPAVHARGGREDVGPARSRIPLNHQQRPKRRKQHMRKITKAGLGIALATGLALTGCSAADLEGGSGGDAAENMDLVLYSTMTENDLNALSSMLEAEFPGIYIEVVSGNAGELTTRIQSESGNPQGDMMWGGLDTADGDKHSEIFEHWLSDYEDEVLPEYKSPNGFYNVDHLSSVAFAVNPELEKELGIEIKGYADLLNPVLKGRILMADPTSSSSAWNNVSNIMAVF